MTAHNDGKILIADRHTHRTVVECLVGVPFATGTVCTGLGP